MEEALIKRTMPSSIEAEQSVIGSMLMDSEVVIMASEALTAGDFYYKQYAVMFDAMVELLNQDKPVDFVTLQDKLKEKDVPPDISSLEYINDLLAAVPTSANVRYYMNIVREKSLLRELIRITENIQNECYAGRENLETIFAETERNIFQLLQSRSSGDYVPIRQIVISALDRIEKASRMQGNVTGIATGFIDLDYRLSGMQPSDLILIAARPSMGKTALALNIVQYTAFHTGLATAVFSLEMSKEQLVNRLFSLESRVDAQTLRNGSLTDMDWEKLSIVRCSAQAPFVLTEYQNRIYISSRSIDEINVQQIMERLGGGGHINIAGAQLTDSNIEEAKYRIREVIDEMIEKGEIEE